MTDYHIRVVPDAELRLEAHRSGWKLHAVSGTSYHLAGVAVDVAKARAAHGINREMIVGAEEDGTYTVFEIEECFTQDDH